MITYQHKIRVRYGEVDKMGFVYHGNYAAYFDTVRTEMLRSFGMSYESMEQNGVMMPVRDMSMTFHKAGKSDDLLTIRLTMKQMPSTRIHFDYEVFNEQGEKLTTANITLFFVDAHTKRPQRAPVYFLDCIGKHFV